MINKIFKVNNFSIYNTEKQKNRKSETEIQIYVSLPYIDTGSIGNTEYISETLRNNYST